MTIARFIENFKAGKIYDGKIRGDNYQMRNEKLENLKLYFDLILKRKLWLIVLSLSRNMPSAMLCARSHIEMNKEF